MPEYLILDLEGPLQAWGDVALDPRRPTMPCPGRSALAGLLGNALGWRYADAARLTALQDALEIAVAEARAPRLVIDFQTADLDSIAPGWTSWGPESMDSHKNTQILHKHYLADAAFVVALGLLEAAPVTLDELAAALRAPARPLFLGRKSCPPAGPLLRPERLAAGSAREAVERLLRPGERYWHQTHDAGPATREVFDRRDFASNRFTGSRRLAESRAPGREEP